jgi:hypothetical protein
MSGYINEARGLNLNWVVLASRGDLLIVRINLQADEDSDGIYAVLEEYKGRYYVRGIGVTYHEALHDAQRRAYESNDKKFLEELEELEMFRRSLFENLGEE